MVRWKCCLVLAMLLVLPKLPAAKEEGSDEDENDENEEEDDEEDDEEEEDHPNPVTSGRRAPAAVPAMTKVTRTTKRAPLECYVCGYRSEMPLRSCLDPTKFRVHSVTCHNLEDKCFTTVITKDKSYVAVIRGCRTGCVGSPDTTCCERDRCNNQAFAMPVVGQQQRATVETADTRRTANTATKNMPSNVLFFVTVLLLLQTVVKVPFV